MLPTATKTCRGPSLCLSKCTTHDLRSRFDLKYQGMEPIQQADKRHLVTVAVEDYFQVGSFNRLIQRGEWYRFEPQVDANTRRAPRSPR